MNWTSRGGLLVLFVALTSCREFRVETPHGFVEVADGADAYRAMAPNGVVLAVRVLETEGAGLAFWRDAVAHRLAFDDSYELKGESKLRSQDGTPGIPLHYTHAESDQTHDYLVALFVKRDAWVLFPQERLFLVESGGPGPAFEQRASQVRAAIASLDLDLPL